MELAVERIVVQTSASDKKRLVAKAEKLGISVAELMRRGAAEYTDDADNKALAALADEARKAAEQAMASIDDALDFIDKSNREIAAMEKKAASKLKVIKAGAA